MRIPELSRLPAPALLLPALVLAGSCTSPEPAGSATDEPGASRVPVRSASPLWPGSGPLEGSDAAVVERLTFDVGWLADDERQGRRAGTQAGRDAAQWLSLSLSSMGLEPAGDEGWMQSLEVSLPAEDGGGSKVRVVDGVALGGSALVVPLFCSDGASAQGPLAWGGYGIVNEERGWDDYAHVRKSGSLQGAVVLIVRGTPPLPEPPPAEEAEGHGALVQEGSGWGNSGSLFTKVMSAKRLGAAAVLIAPHPSQADDPLPAFDASRPAQASIPCVLVSSSVAAKLEPAYAAMVASLDAGQGPAAFLPQTAPTVEVVADVRREKGDAWNVLGRLPGADSSRVVVVGAHYDHLGLGGEGSLAPDALGQVHNGADDNASGTAAVLEMARQLAAGPQPGCDVVFALWTAEEQGLIGSEHWAQHPTVPLDAVVANLNLDMVGRAGDGKLAVLGAGTAAPFEAWVREAGPYAGLELDVSLSGRGVGGSDHMTFLKREIPALHFFSGVHTDYHKPSDDTERFEADGTRRVVALGIDLVRRIAAAPRAELAYVEPQLSDEQEQGERQRLASGWRVWFGTVPEYTYEGEGLLLSGTSPGSPAERAGLLAGDVILQVGEIEIDTIHDFVFALQTYKPGDVVLTRYLRDGQPQEVRITLATREAQ